MKISVCVHCGRRIQLSQHYLGDTWVHKITGLCYCGDTFTKLADPIEALTDTSPRWGYNQPGTVSMLRTPNEEETWLLAGREALRRLSPMAVYAGTGTCDTWTLQAIVNPDGTRTAYFDEDSST